MITSEDDVSAALQYLALDPHPIALAQGDRMTAENRKDRAYSRAFLEAEGSVEERKCKAKIDHEYWLACIEERRATEEHERHRQRVKSADTLCKIFQTENANIRAAERIR